MRQRKDKRVPLADAASMVPSGARLALGGFGVYERPMAFTRELVRQGTQDLTVVGHVSGPEVDLLAAAGALSAVETSYVGLERFGLAPNFSRAVDAGQVEWRIFSEQASFDRFRASQAGLTFWPVIGIAGTDLAENNPQVVEQQCPFTGTSYYAITPANPDVVVIHAGRGDRYGNIALPEIRQPSHSLDVILAQGCDTVIVTVEEIVEPEVLARDHHLVEIPAFQVAAVVEAPWGGHPTSVLGYYAADDDAFRTYLEASRPDGGGVVALCAADEDAYRSTVPDPAWAGQTKGSQP